MAGHKRVRHAHGWAVVEKESKLIESLHYSRRAARSRKQSAGNDNLKVVKLIPSQQN